MQGEGGEERSQDREEEAGRRLVEPNRQRTEAQHDEDADQGPREPDAVPARRWQLGMWCLGDGSAFVRHAIGIMDQERSSAVAIEGGVLDANLPGMADIDRSGVWGAVVGFYRSLQDAWRSFSEDRAIRMGAGIAYYSLFALAPLLFLGVSVAGIIIGEEVVRTELASRLSNFFGVEVAELITELIERTSENPFFSSSLSLISLGVLLFGASVLFAAWRDALNLIFDVPWKRGIGASVRRRVVALGLVLLFSAAVLAMALAQAIVAAVERISDIEIIDAGLQVVVFVAPYAVAMVLLALMYKYAPDAELHWMDVIYGAIPAGLGLALGTWLYGLYLGSIGSVTATSVAGALFLLLAWIYYSAQILLFGAELIKVRDQHRVVSQGGEASSLNTSDGK